MLWLFTIFSCSLLLFSKGFLLNRVVVGNVSNCQTNYWLLDNLWNGINSEICIKKPETIGDCKMKLEPKFKKVIFVVIDGLRYDFLTHKPDVDLKNALPFENKMIKLHNLLDEEPFNGKLFRFEADPPTTTMQRIKGITTGKLFISFLKNSKPQSFS